MAARAERKAKIRAQEKFSIIEVKSSYNKEGDTPSNLDNTAKGGTVGIKGLMDDSLNEDKADIEVTPNVVNENSEQHGLMGVGASANLKDDFFDDDKDAIKNRKPKITDAIEDADTRKKIVVKKKKKKGTKVQKGDTNMLSYN